MKKSTKLVISGVIGGAVALMIWHARGAGVAVPKDMPSNAKFLQSGFEVSTNEPLGNWVACSLHPAESVDWCRVTDQKGTVVYQGDFLPVNSTQPLPDAELIVMSANPKKIWVHGPVEDGPVPAIPLTSGSVLVPASDRYALMQRWASDSTEYDSVRESTSD